MPASSVSAVLLRALLLTVTPHTARLLTNYLLDMLEDIVNETETDLDNKLFELLKRFLRDTEGDPRLD